MRNVFVVVLAAAGMTIVGAQGAGAADLGVPYTPPPPPPSWTGFYIGLNGGAGWGTTATSVNVGQTLALNGIPGINLSVPLAQTSLNGWLAGGQIGYNYQIGNYLVGIEGEGDWANISGTSPCAVVFSCTSKVKWTADIAGRFGVVPIANLLVYVKGGVSWAGLQSSFGNGISGTVGPITFAGDVNANLNTTQVGGLLGIGTEYMFAPNWTAKIEYTYADYGKENFTVPVNAAGGVAIAGGPTLAGSTSFPTSVQSQLQVHTVKFGINYLFNL
ncbi:MAG TPA: outer membrane beta-barrel protein [Xanthobacteraceae bacterium]|nr:outer membrane beta-barrel protein [Xanthobacteraceae bacterium]